YHEGIDIPLKDGTPLGAIKGGYGWKARILPFDETYGNRVMLYNDNEQYYFIYNHLNDFTYLLYRDYYGSEVIDVQYKYQLIAISGATGLARGAHLHLMAKVGDLQVNPLLYTDHIIYQPNIFPSPSGEGRALSNNEVLMTLRTNSKSKDVKEADVMLIKVNGHPVDESAWAERVFSAYDPEGRVNPTPEIMSSKLLNLGDAQRGDWTIGSYRDDDHGVYLDK